MPQLATLSETFETNTRQAFQQQALEGVKEEYAQYFEALKKHPRLLIGAEVPSLQGEEGQMETLRDASDAKDWQDAVKSLLVEEIQERAERALDDNSEILSTVHASIELFTKNKDLIPGTKQFNRRLADRFAAITKPYELRVDGKLHGYTIPVQPLVDQLRMQMKNEPAPVTSSVPEKRSPGRPKTDKPQAGIKSKAGSGTESEDFSVLFGTLGLPNLRI